MPIHDPSNQDLMTNVAVAPMLAFVTAWLRAWNEGKSMLYRCIDGSMLGLATVAVIPVLEWLGLPAKLAIFLGVSMGFIGVETLKIWIKRFVDNKIGNGSKK